VTEYVNLYSGPEMLMHFKYSNVLNIALVCLTHGIAMPLLFPIGLLGIANNYFTERILLAYYYRQPPMIDNRMNERALNLLEKSPILMLCAGYWYLGNRQIFFNEYAHIEENFGEVKDTGHRVFDYSKGPDHTIMLLIIAICVLFQRNIVKVIMRTLQCMGCFLRLKKLEQIENEV
jgi:hypothetical protein